MTIAQLIVRRWPGEGVRWMLNQHCLLTQQHALNGNQGTLPHHSSASLFKAHQLLFPVSPITGRQVANAQVSLNSAVIEEGVWSQSSSPHPTLPVPHGWLLWLFKASPSRPRTCPHPQTTSCYTCCAILPGRKVALREAEPLTEVTREPGGTAGTEMQPVLYPRRVPAPPKAPMQLRQDLPVNQGKTGGDHPPTERGKEQRPQRKRRAEPEAGLLLQPGFASLAPSFHRGSDPVALAGSGGSLTLRVETGGLS